MWLEDFLRQGQQLTGWPDAAALQLLTQPGSRPNPAAFDEIYRALDGVGTVIVLGGEGRGKTTVVRAVAFTRQRDIKESVWHIDLSRYSQDELQETLHQIRGIHQRLYVVENVQSDPDATDDIAATRVGNPESKFILTDRRTDDEEALDLNRPHRRVFLNPTVEDYRRIIQRWVTTRQLAHVASPTGPELDAILRRTGANLRSLAAYLAAWHSGSLLDVSDDAVCDSVWEHRFAQLSQAAQLAFVRISAIAQFDTLVDTSRIDGGSLKELAQNGLIQAVPKGLTYLYGIAHPTEAALNVKTWGTRTQSSPQELAREALRDYVLSGASNTAFVISQVRKAAFWLLKQLMSEPQFATIVQNEIFANVATAPIGYFATSASLLSTDPPRLEALYQCVFSLDREDLKSKYAAASLVKLTNFRSFMPARFGRQHRDILSSLSTQEWTGIWARTTLPALTKFIFGRYAAEPEVHKHTDLARDVLLQVASAPDFGDRINTVSLEIVGKLVKAADDLDARAALPLLCENISKNLKLRDRVFPNGTSEAINFEKLSLILSNMAAAGQLDARDRLVERILETFDVDDFLNEASGKGLAYVLHHAAAARASIGASVQAFMKHLLAMDLSEKVSGWQDVAVARFIWACWQMDPVEISPWLRNNAEVLANALARANSEQTWWILWNTFVADFATAIQMWHLNHSKVMGIVSARKPQSLSLAGLGRWLGREIAVKEIFDPEWGCPSGC